jgi:hypothetical protein
MVSAVTRELRAAEAPESRGLRKHRKSCGSTGIRSLSTIVYICSRFASCKTASLSFRTYGRHTTARTYYLTHKSITVPLFAIVT